MARSPYSMRICQDAIDKLRAMPNASEYLERIILSDNDGNTKLLKQYLHINGLDVPIYCERDLRDLSVRFTKQKKT